MSTSIATLDTGIVECIIDITGWDEDEMAQYLARYEHYLERCAHDDGAIESPDREIDLIWHIHMLHPVHYSEYCQQRFGRTIDHVVRKGSGKDVAAALAGTGCNQKSVRMDEDETGLGVARSIAGTGCNHHEDGKGRGSSALRAAQALAGTGCNVKPGVD